MQQERTVELEDKLKEIEEARTGWINEVDLLRKQAESEKKAIEE